MRNRLFCHGGILLKHEWMEVNSHITARLCTCACHETEDSLLPAKRFYFFNSILSQYFKNTDWSTSRFLFQCTQILVKQLLMLFTMNLLFFPGTKVIMQNMLLMPHFSCFLVSTQKPRLIISFSSTSTGSSVFFWSLCYQVIVWGSSHLSCADDCTRLTD